MTDPARLAALRKQVFVYGLDDWVALDFVGGAAHVAGLTPNDAAAATGLLTELVAANYFEIGTVTRAGFTPADISWATVESILHGLLADDTTTDGFVRWLNLTAAGVRAFRDEVGEEEFAELGGDPPWLPASHPSTESS